MRVFITKVKEGSFHKKSTSYQYCTLYYLCGKKGGSSSVLVVICSPYSGTYYGPAVHDGQTNNRARLLATLFCLCKTYILKVTALKTLTLSYIILSLAIAEQARHWLWISCVVLFEWFLQPFLGARTIWAISQTSQTAHTPLCN